MNQTVCRVHILDLPFHADRPFDYFCPETGQVPIGTFVAVPFGGGNRTRLGIVTGAGEYDGKRRLKPVHAVVYPEFAVDEQTMGLVRYLSDHTLCSYGDAIKAILPVGAFAHLTDAYYPADALTDAQREHGGQILAYLTGRPGASGKQIEKHCGQDADKRLVALVRDGIVERRVCVGGQNRRYDEQVTLACDPQQALCSAACIRSKKRAQIVRFLEQNGSVDFARLKSEFALTRAQLTAMTDLGLVTVHRTDAYRTPYSAPSQLAPPTTLSAEQSAARDTLCAMCDEDAAGAALLYGVTGSGKTQVIRAVMDHVIASGKGVILLVPEISLTPQTVQLFSSWYGERIAVIHSGLSAGERFDAWRRIRAHEADICIGTRSAVFAPFERLGLIVLDEEQEHTYKSDQNPKYHARDVARYRCAKAGAVMLLASATPSVESFYKAQTGKYRLLRLTERYGTATLPDTIMADLRDHTQSGNLSVIGGILSEELQKNLSAGEQSVLFVNRRGYNNFLSCNVCGYVKTCPHCSVSMTYHTRGRYRSDAGESIPAARARNGYLVCHYCGYREGVPAKCPECGNEQLQFMGFGTQMAENALQDAYPDVRITRMDADTTQNKFSYDQMLDDFRKSGSDILLGTQMVTKGHDFPDVTLVGVLCADASLYLDDYRANERTFSLLTQVIGRAGRAQKHGRAVIQTYSPDHDVLRYAAAQDYDAFYTNEIAMRRALVFPPFCDIALFFFSCRFEEELFRVSTAFSAAMQECLKDDRYAGVQLQAFGPFEAPIYKRQDQYRMRLVVKCVANTVTRSMFAALLRRFGEQQNKVNIQMDLNPSSL